MFSNEDTNPHTCTMLNLTLTDDGYLTYPHDANLLRK